MKSGPQKNNRGRKAEPVTPKASPKEKENESGDYGRAMASLFLSIINYGWNVANRPPLPKGLQQKYGYKETGRKVLVIGEEESYLRMRDDHPSRRIIEALYQLMSIEAKDLTNIGKYTPLIQKIFSDNLDPSLLCNVDQILKFLKKFTEKERATIAEILMLATVHGKKAIDTRALKFGRLLTPEQCLEAVFAKLPAEKVDLIFELFAGKSAATLNSLIELPKISPSNDNQAPAAPAAVSYSENINQRLRFIERFQDKAKELNLKHFKIIADGNQYPCITFDCMDFLSASKIGRNNHDLMTHFITAAFCGLLNYYSIQRYGKNFIWTATQNSFGSIRPSLTDTNASFRLSPGLASDDYAEVITKAIKHLDILAADFCNNTKETTENFTKTKDTLFTEHKRTAMHVELLNLLAKKNAAEDMDANNPLIALFEIVTKKNVDEVVNNDIADMDNLISKVNPPHPCNAPPFAVNALRALVIAYHHDEAGIKTGIKCLTGIEATIQEKLGATVKTAEILLSRGDNNCDYSATCTCIEHLTRLLKIKNDLKAIRHCHTVAKKKTDTPDVPHQDEEQAFFARRGHRRALSQDIVYPSVGGMASLTDIIKCLEVVDVKMEFTGDKYFEFYNVDPHSLFEVTASTLTELPTKKKPVKSKAGGDKKAESKDSLIISIADLTPFPYKTEMPNALETALKNVSQQRPDILILDITATHPDLIEKLIFELRSQFPNKPAYIITFASDHKLSQLVDLVSMGEIRVLSLVNADEKDIHPNVGEAVEKIQTTLRKRETDFLGDTFSAESARQTFEALGTRRSMKPRASVATHGLHQPRKEPRQEKDKDKEETSEKSLHPNSKTQGK